MKRGELPRLLSCKIPFRGDIDRAYIAGQIGDEVHDPFGLSSRLQDFGRLVAFFHPDVNQLVRLFHWPLFPVLGTRAVRELKIEWGQTKVSLCVPRQYWRIVKHMAGVQPALQTLADYLARPELDTLDVGYLRAVVAHHEWDTLRAAALLTLIDVFPGTDETSSSLQQAANDSDPLMRLLSAIQARTDYDDELLKWLLDVPAGSHGPLVKRLHLTADRRPADLNQRLFAEIAKEPSIQMKIRREAFVLLAEYEPQVDDLTDLLTQLSAGSRTWPELDLLALPIEHEKLAAALADYVVDARHKDALPVLEKLAAQVGNSTRSLALDTISRLEDPQHESALLAVIEQCADCGIVEAALSTIAKMGTALSRDALERTSTSDGYTPLHSAGADTRTREALKRTRDALASRLGSAAAERESVGGLTEAGAIRDGGLSVSDEVGLLSLEGAAASEVDVGKPRDSQAKLRQATPALNTRSERLFSVPVVGDWLEKSIRENVIELSYSSFKPIALVATGASALVLFWLVHGPIFTEQFTWENIWELVIFVLAMLFAVLMAPRCRKVEIGPMRYSIQQISFGGVSKEFKGQTRELECNLSSSHSVHVAAPDRVVALNTTDPSSARLLYERISAYIQEAGQSGPTPPAADVRQRVDETKPQG